MAPSGASGLARRKPEARSQKPEVAVRFLASDFWLLIAGISHLIVVGLGRLELPTSRLSGVRSNHLSYRPDLPCSRSCLKKEKRRRRNPALVSRIGPIPEPVRCLGRADRKA